MRLRITCDVEPADHVEIVFSPDRIGIYGKEIAITKPEKVERIIHLMKMWSNGQVWRMEDEEI